MSEDLVPQEGAAALDAVGQELAGIEADMKSNSPAYWKDESRQARYRELLGAREGGAAPPPPPAGTAKRISDLERMMADLHGPYYKGPSADALQAEYRDLISRRDGLRNGEARTDAAADAGVSFLPQSALKANLATSHSGLELIDEWNNAGGFERNLEVAQETIITVFSNIHPDDRSEFLASVNQLPERVQNAALAECARGSMSVGRATQDQLERFATTTEGRWLLREWGNQAPQKLLALRARTERLVRGLSPDDKAEFISWLDGLAPAQAEAVYKALAA